MPLERHNGTTIADLESAVATIESRRRTVIQIVGQYDGAWWILVSSPSRQTRETRTA